MFHFSLYNFKIAYDKLQLMHTNYKIIMTKGVIFRKPVKGCMCLAYFALHVWRKTLYYRMLKDVRCQ